MFGQKVREDGYEWRVRQIFKKLRCEYRDDGSTLDFADWLLTTKGTRAVMFEFLEDVEVYMGIPEED